MRKIAIVVLSLFILSTGAVSFSAELPAAPLMVKDYAGIPYVSGGIGSDEREAMSAMAKGYNLKIVFALKQGNYLADASVVVKDAQGKTVLDAVSDGPWFYAKLPAGRYAVTATVMETAHTENVQIKPDGHSVLYFYWPE